MKYLIIVISSLLISFVSLIFSFIYCVSLWKTRDYSYLNYEFYSVIITLIFSYISTYYAKKFRINREKENN